MMSTTKSRLSLLQRVCFSTREFCSVRSCATQASKSLRYDPEPAVFGSRLFWAERRRQRYKDLLGRLRMEHPRFMIVDEKRIALPLRLDSEPLIDGPEEVPERVLQSLATFFGECGCMGCWNHGKVDVRLNQVYYRGERLVQFQRVFGGTIYSSSGYRGGQEPQCSLILPLHQTVRMAEVLSKFPSSKAERLNVVLSCREQRPSISHMRKILASAKARESCGNISSVESCASFLDRHGCMRVHPDGHLLFHVNLRSQSHENQFQIFVQKNDLPAGLLCSNGNRRGTRWVLSTRHDILAWVRLLQPHVVVKKKLMNAIIACDDEARPFLDLRKDGTKYWGDRSLLRVDDQAVEMTSKIRRVRDMIRHYRGANQHVPQSCFDKLMQLYHERHEHKADLRAENVRCKVRNLLDRGAHVLPH